MKKLTPLYLLLSSIIILNSCTSVSYFSPALVANDYAYLPKPMASDSIKTKNYISASVAGLTLPYSSGQLTMGMLNISRATTFKHINIAYGAYGVVGETKYNNNLKAPNTTPSNSYRGFTGGGLRTSIGFHDGSGNAEFRMLSWESSLSFENGAYSQLRKNFIDNRTENVITTNKTTLFTTGGATEFIWHTKSNYDNQFGIKLFIGITPGLKDSYNKVDEDFNSRVGNFSFFFKVNKLYGIFDLGGSRGLASRASLGYSF